MKDRLRKPATTDEQRERWSKAFEVNEKQLPPEVFTLRQKLYEKAKREPRFRFYALYDRIYRRDVLRAAWVQVASNDGSPGVDGVSIDHVRGQPDGPEALVEALHEELRTKTYRPQAVRRVWIEKPNGGQRPLGIPTVRDRVVQTAALLILEPIFEADFRDSSYGFRPKRRAHDALQEVAANLRAGRTAVLDADLQSYFDTIPHDKLRRCLEMRISDRSVLRLIGLWLQTPIEDPPDDRGGPPTRHRPEAGTPQGGVISPLLANVYLHWLDVLFEREGPGAWANARIVRYADDLVIMARYVSERIEAWTSDLLERRMGLTLNREKTQRRTVQLNRDTLTFLGHTFRWERGRFNGRPYLRREPSAAALKRARSQIRLRTSSHRCHVPISAIVSSLNQYLRSWAPYFRVGHPQRAFRKLDYYVMARMGLHLNRRSQRPFRCPEGQTLYEHVHTVLGVVRLSALHRA